MRTTTTSGLEWDTMLFLLDHLHKDGKLRDYLFIASGCYLGLRVGDLCNLKWSDVLNKDEIYITEGKTKKRRKLTVNSNLKEVFKTVVNSRVREGRFNEGDYLFANRWGRKITIQYLNRRLHSIFDKYHIRVQNGSTHTLRKTFGKKIYEMNGQSESSLIQLSLIFSHNSIATTKRYIGITDKQIADVYLNL